MCWFTRLSSKRKLDNPLNQKILSLLPGTKPLTGEVLIPFPRHKSVPFLSTKKPSSTKDPNPLI